MKKLSFILLFLVFISFSSFSQEKIATVIDTIKNYNRFDIVLFDNYTWQYVNHDSIAKIINYEDSIKIYDYILKTKIFKADSLLIFSNNWDTTMILPYGNLNFERTLDTVVIKLTNDNNKFNIPNQGNISSKFGWRHGRMHQGIDLKLYSGDTVVAAFDGIVRYAGYMGAYGNLIIIRHLNGLETFYSHLSSIKCNVNTFVKAGELIGLGGRTGRATGTHLHFEVRYKDNPINPELIIDFENGELTSNLLYLMPDKFTHVKEICESEYHTISSGDNLYNISKRYRTSIKNLCKLNNISENTILKIGTSIRVR